MLLDALPRVMMAGDPLAAGTDYEGFMAAYLASYNAAGTNPRVVQSYTRAFGFDAIYRFPRVGQVPSFVVLKYVDGNNRRIVVGIEGVPNPSFLVTILCARGLPAVAAQQGRVLQLFWDAATSIMAQINAAGILDTPATGIEDWQLSGYSLGAGIAEVMATRLGGTGANGSTRTVVCTKYGSPRVGNANWNNYLASRSDISIFTEYCGDDPIYNFPRQMPNTAYTAATSFGAIWTNFDLASPLAVRDFYTGDVARRHQGNTADLLRLVNYLTQSYSVPPNPWYWHSIFSYRLMLMNRLGGLTVDLDYYRFRWLEHEDENSFGSTWQRGVAMARSAFTLLDPPPDDVKVPFSLLPSAGDTSSDLGGGGQDWGGAADAAVATRPGGTSEGGDWGYVPGNAPQRRAGRLTGR